MSGKKLDIQQTIYSFKVLPCQPLVKGFPTSFKWVTQRQKAEEMPYIPISMSLFHLSQTIIVFYLRVSCISVTFEYNFGEKIEMV